MNAPGAFRDWWNPDKTKPLELGGQQSLQPDHPGYLPAA